MKVQELFESLEDKAKKLAKAIENNDPKAPDWDEDDRSRWKGVISFFPGTSEDDAREIMSTVDGLLPEIDYDDEEDDE